MRCSFLFRSLALTACAILICADQIMTHPYPTAYDNIDETHDASAMQDDHVQLTMAGHPLDAVPEDRDFVGPYEHPADSSDRVHRIRFDPNESIPRPVLPPRDPSRTSSHNRRPTPYTHGAFQNLDDTEMTPVPAPRSHTRTDSQHTNVITRPGILSGHDHQNRWPGQFLEPRFRNAILRDATMALADFQGTLLFLLIAFFGSGAQATTNEVSVAYAMGLLATVFCHASSQANPSISMMQAFLGKLSVRQAMFNIVAQITAAIAASGIQTWALGHTQSIATLQHTNAAQGLLIETVMSTILYTTVLWASAVPNVQQHMMPFLIALVFYGLEMCSIPYTSGSLNIARWLGPAVVSNTWPSHSWVWATGPLIATPLSIAIFKANQLLQHPRSSADEQTHVGPGQIIELDEERQHVGLPRRPRSQMSRTSHFREDV